MQLLRVMPGRTVPPEMSGVTILPSILNMTFIAPTSSMYFISTPSSQRTWEKPFFSASSPARMEAA